MMVGVPAAAATADAATGVLVIAVAAVIVVIEVQGVNAIDGCGRGAWREGWMELWAVWVASGSTIVVLLECWWPVVAIPTFLEGDNLRRKSTTVKVSTLGFVTP